MKKLLLIILLLSNYFGHAQYTLIPDVNFEKALIGLGIDSGTPDGKVLTSNVSGLTYLNVSGSQITDLTGIQDFTSLTQLYCTANKLTILDMTKNTALSVLYCYSNQLTSLDVSRNPALTNLVCSSNQLTSLDVNKNIALIYLDCYNNQITRFDITKNIGLKYMDCSRNQLNSLNLSNSNNTILQSINFLFNTNLNCIQVDNKTYSDTNWSSAKDATASYSENCNYKVAAIAPPEITATGNQIYCPGTTQKIVETISIKNDPAEPSIASVYVQISSGYQNGQDKLALANQNSLHPNIKEQWVPSEGKLTLSSSTTGGLVTYSDFESALKDVVYSNSSTAPSGIRTFSINLGAGTLSYLPSNKHFYEYVPNIGIKWTDAKIAAEQRTYYGLKGYLATLTAADEAQLAGSQAPGAGWIGGSDAEIEGTWKWVTGPEGLANGGTGTVFWMGQGATGYVTPPFNFALWNAPREPNNDKDEDYAHITAPGSEISIKGSWNDLPNQGLTGNYQPKGYIVEYGGMVANDVDNIKISASTTLTIGPTIISTTSNPICGSGSVNLLATASLGGTVNWYDAAVGGNLLKTGNSYNTPNLNSSTTYYVDAGCPSSVRTAVAATIKQAPTIISTTPNFRRDSGTLELKATVSAGTINWYNAPNGGTPLSSGTSYTTPNLQTTTDFYVDATENGCTSQNRTKITATIISPPEITATGNQIYCSGTAQKIVETISIKNDPAELDTDAIYIQISSGYVYGQDKLDFINTALHPTITSSWDVVAGKLKLYSPTGIKVLYSDFKSAIEDVVYSNSASNPSGIRNFSITIGQANYLPSTGHYYEYVANTGITWTAAKTAAESLKYYGLQGYLATLLAADEAKLSGEQANGAGWIGGSDAETEGVWKWVTGPEAGTVFWNGLSNGSTPNYANWNIGEPNQYLGRPENYAHIAAPGTPNSITGSWNDLTNTGDATGNYQPKGYIVEYGGMPGDPILKISASTSITIPRIESTIPNAICDSGTLTLQATASNGSVYWYDTNTSTTPIATGNTYTTPTLYSTRSYYVDASNGYCPGSLRKEIIAQVDKTPTITGTTPNFRCDAGPVTLGAISSGGTINWYKDAIGGTPLGSGTTFTTPTITTTTTYYAETVSNGCKVPNRTPVTATIYITPIIDTATVGTICDSGSITIGATTSTGNIRWFDQAIGGTLLQTGNTYSIPIINTTTTYYAEVFTSTCTNPMRAPITVLVYNSPSITTTKTDNRCDTGTLTLGATASAGTINWYDSLTGGTLLGTGTTFVTPSLSATTTYYVDATNNNCTSPTRTAITATVYTTPTITSTTPDSRCDSGTVSLAATASAGAINWYSDLTGGSPLATGTTFTTPSISKTTSYYVDAIENNCASPKRTEIIATVYPIDTKTEEVILCQGETITLEASVAGMNYLWSPRGETTQSISVSTIGNYNLTISSPTVVSCDSYNNFSVIEHPAPIINSISVNENSITIELADPENYFEYSINGIDFQLSNQFSYIPSGQHTAYVREKNGCNLVLQNFTIFTIAKYFTPNNDGQNDVWKINEMKDYPNSSAQIFDRYGKLLINLTAFKNYWDGKYNNQTLPSDDYWYRLKLDDTTPVLTGHFTLKR